MNKCATCKHWSRVSGDFDVRFHGAHAGNCASDAFTYTDEQPTPKIPKDGLGYWDYEGYSAGFMTGEDFGCVHHSPLEKGNEK